MAFKIKRGMAKNLEKKERTGAGAGTGTGVGVGKNYAQKRVNSNLSKKKLDVSAILNRDFQARNGS